MTAADIDTDRVALVTGGGRGIGRGIALRLAADGLDVAVNDVNGDAAEAVADEVRAAGRRSAAVPADVGDRDAAFAMVERVIDELGGLDVVVNNAGIARTALILDTSPEDLEALFRVNVHGVFWCMQAAASAMKDRGGGKIINAASIAGHDGFAYLAAYSGTKHAVAGLTRAGAKEFAEHGITVNAYCPGIVDTDMWEAIDADLGGYLGTGRGEAMQQYAAGIPLGRVERPEDVAAFVSYLASSDADYMTGQSVLIDGGMLMR
jgi:meso-butanediol dehydrogenase/(S,S)-butanediol dehydrogenase/diacetyl reductase